MLIGLLKRHSTCEYRQCRSAALLRHPTRSAPALLLLLLAAPAPALLARYSCISSPCPAHRTGPSQVAMTSDWTTEGRSAHARSHDECEPRRLRSVRLTRIIALAMAVALLVSAVLVIPGWIPLLPRSVRRGLTEGMLRAVLFGYGGLVSGVARRDADSGCDFAQISPCAAKPAARRKGLADRGFVLVFADAARAGLDRLAVVDAPVSEAAGELSRRGSLVHSGSWCWGARVRLGEPYRPWISPGQIVAWRLAEAIPARRFECEILAWLGDSLEMQHRKLAALKRRPEW